MAAVDVWQISRDEVTGRYDGGGNPPPKKGNIVVQSLLSRGADVSFFFVLFVYYIFFFIINEISIDRFYTVPRARIMIYIYHYPCYPQVSGVRP